MTAIDTRIAEQVASVVRDGVTDEVRRLLITHPECLAFLDLPESLTCPTMRSWCDYAQAHGHVELSSLFLFELPPDPVHVQLAEAQRNRDAEQLKSVLTEHPRYFAAYRTKILVDAAREGQIKIAELLLEMGAEINAPDLGGASALSCAASCAGPDMVEYLLSRGADPNDVGRPIISAINREPEELAVRLVQLLVEHGADVNREYTVYGDKENTFTALEWAASKPTIAEYLRSKGAIEREKTGPARAPAKNLADGIVAYFDEHFGPPQPQAQIEIVPSEPPISIHLIPAAESRKHVTLFTTGMSEEPMTLPEGTDDFRFAELFIQLPGNWPIDKKSLSSPKYGWPTQWLRSIAKYPHQHETWLGGPVTIIANGDPPEPLAPGLSFTSLLVMADRNFISRDGRTIYLYRLMPLYTEERDLEKKRGIAALMRAFDKHDIASVVDLKRRNVAVSEP